jgi:hypothetical protein
MDHAFVPVQVLVQTCVLYQTNYISRCKIFGLVSLESALVFNVSLHWSGVYMSSLGFLVRLLVGSFFQTFAISFALVYVDCTQLFFIRLNITYYLSR